MRANRSGGVNFEIAKGDFSFLNARRPTPDAERCAPIRIAAVILLALLSFTSLSSAARGKSPATSRPASSTAKAETVYVASPTPPSHETREMRAVEPVRDAEPRRSDASFSTGPARDYPSAVGMYGGFYVAEVLGSNPYGVVYYDLYPRGQGYFFQFDFGVGTVQSGFSKEVVGGDIFDHNLLLSFDALGGLSLSGLANGLGRAGGLFPYFIAGITAFWQGGIPIVQEAVPNVGGVIGFGNRMKLPFLPRNNEWAFNYVVRDNIYSQKIRTTPSLTQNFVLLIGVQKYF